MFSDTKKTEKIVEQKKTFCKTYTTTLGHKLSKTLDLMRPLKCSLLLLLPIIIPNQQQ